MLNSYLEENVYEVDLDFPQIAEDTSHYTYNVFKGVVVPVMWDDEENPILYHLVTKQKRYILKPFGSIVLAEDYIEQEVFVYGELLDESSLYYYDIRTAQEVLMANTS